MLTGKAKEDFWNWIYEKYYKEPYDFSITQASRHEFNGFVIEWLDSVGIYINILNKDLQGWFYYKIVYLEIKEGSILYRTRQEATTAAIKKANEIYNQKYYEIT